MFPKFYLTLVKANNLEISLVVYCQKLILNMGIPLRGQLHYPQNQMQVIMLNEYFNQR